MLVFAVLVIGHTYMSTGSFFYKGVSLAGGLTITVATEGAPLSVQAVETALQGAFPDADFVVREVSEFGTQIGVTIEGSTVTNSQESLDALEKGIIGILDTFMSGAAAKVSSEVVGPSLGASFFQQTTKAVLIAFVFMGMVVFLYFGSTTKQKAFVVLVSLLEGSLIWYSGNTIAFFAAILLGICIAVLYLRLSMPSAAVIIAAVSTITFTIAIVDLMQMRLSTAGVAAFLMLIGYSVDTDILLSTRVLKRSGGTVYDRVKDALTTGLTMTGTTFIATIVAFLFTKSTVIKEIMLIIAIGLVADVLFTWIQNVGLLRWHLERKQ